MIIAEILLGLAAAGFAELAYRGGNELIYIPAAVLFMAGMAVHFCRPKEKD